MSIYAIVIALWCLAQVAVGVWISRRVRTSGDFFVAGRDLSSSAIFATFLAANIGAGSTVAATGYAYEHGLAAWWWNGSAGIGTLILAFWVGPRLWRTAQQHNLYTAGDYLAFRYSEGLRGLTALLIWIGSFAILSGQLIGGAAVLYVVFGWPAWLGGLVSTLIVTIYFSAGGLLGSSWVHRVQIVVIVAGFLLAAMLAVSAAGGWDAMTVANAERMNFWRGRTPDMGWPLLLLLGPSFFLSPGLVQRAFAARDLRHLRRGIALSGLALMAFATLPVILGMAARVHLPPLEVAQNALPEMLRYGVPPWVGAFALAAVFAAEMSSADAVLFMLSTSGARDLYKRFVKRDATDAEELRTVRVIAIAAAVIGYVLIFVIGTVGGALRIFYSVMVVSLFVPILATLLIARPSTKAAYASVIAGIAALFGVAWLTGGRGYGWASPVFVALLVSAAAFGLASLGPAGRPGNADGPARI
ncbi:MAG TPA: sodium:solute symporter family protein [Vicinamibacterales bacterium]